MTEAITVHPTFRDVLRFREFRWIWLADTQSALGDQLTRVAIAILVFSRTNSAALTALAFGMSYLPALLGGLFLSGLADRYPRRRVLVGCDLARAGLVALLAVPAMPVAVLCGLIAAGSLASSLFSSGENALIPQVLPSEVYPVATAMRTTSHQLSQLVGFVVGGIVVGLIGPHPAMLVDAATFILSALALLRGVRRRPSARQNSGISYGRSIILAAQRISRDPRLRVLAIIVWTSAFYTVQEGIAAPYAASVGAGSAGAGLLLAATPAGTAVGAFLFAHYLDNSRRTATMPYLAMAAGVPLIACGLRPDLIVTLALWFVAGLLGAYFIQAISLFTISIENESRSQVIGLAAAILITCQGGAMSVAGVVAEYVSPAGAIAIAGLGGLLVSGFLSVGFARISRITPA